MDIRSLRDAAFISRFFHILILATAIAVGVHFRSHAIVAALVALWFIIYVLVYFLLKPRPHS
jgi:hypothetical protein